MARLSAIKSDIPDHVAKRWEAQPLCKAGHPFTTENSRTRHVPGNGWSRECRTCLRTNGRLLTVKEMAVAKDALKRRLPLSKIRKLVNINAFLRQQRQDPEFEALVKNSQEGFGVRRIRHIKTTHDRRRVDHINGFIPKHFPQHVRVEILSMVFEALSRVWYPSHGKFFLRDVAGCMPKFIRAYYRLHPVKAFGTVGTPWSLDAPIRDTDLKLIDKVSEGLW